jgi:cytochrome c5
MKRKTPILAMMLLITSAAPVWGADGKAIYDSVCYKCHRTGVDEAPKTGNKAEWAPRIVQGMEVLYKSVIEGKGAMDPRAGRPELSDEEIKAGVEYLVGLAK